MQKPRFKTTEKAAWVFANTRLRKPRIKTVDRRTATRSGFLTTAARLTNVTEKELPLPLHGEPMSAYVARVLGAAASQADG